MTITKDGSTTEASLPNNLPSNSLRTQDPLQFSDPFQPSDQRPIRLRKRSDLTVRRQVYRDEAFWLIKDPLELQFYRLNEEEYAVLELIDGNASLEDIKTHFERQFSPQRITHRQLQTFIADLRKKSLLAFLDSDVGPMLIEREREKKNEKLKKTLTSVLSMKWRGVDPDRFLDWVTPKIRWIFSMPAVIAGFALILSAALWLLVHHQAFASKLPGLRAFLAGENWLALGLVVVTMKVIHELAHAISFKRYGGECHEIGVLLMMGIIPTLYCSTTDSWLLKNKWQRAAIGAAGMYVELVIAAIATFLWWFSQPGTLNMVCLNLMVAGTASVVLMNANPFFKFDGYYIFSDILELPNLYERSGKQTQGVFLKYGLGIDEPVEVNSRSSTQFELFAYRISSFVFKVFFLILIKFMLIDRLNDVGLGYVGLAIGVMGLAALLVPPCISLFQFFKIPGRIQRIEMKNLLLFTTAIVGLAGFVFAVPLPHHVTCGFTIEPNDGQAVYIKHTAILRNVYVEPGQAVRTGDRIADLENLDQQIELAQLMCEIEEEQTQLDLMESSRRSSAKDSARMVKLTESLQTKRKRAEEYQRIVDSYRVVATHDGQVIPHWIRPQSEHGLELQSFDGATLSEKNIGSWMPDGTKLCTIGDLKTYDAVLAVNEHDISLLRPGQSVSLMIDALPDTRLAGSIASLARQETQNLPGALSKKFGGAIEITATEQDGDTTNRPADEHFEARVELPTRKQPLSSGLRGQANVRVGEMTLYERFERIVFRSFRKKLN